MAELAGTRNISRRGGEGAARFSKDPIVASRMDRDEEGDDGCEPALGDRMEGILKPRIHAREPHSRHTRARSCWTGQMSHQDPS